jgi:hypothetical protein
MMKRFLAIITALSLATSAVAQFVPPPPGGGGGGGTPSGPTGGVQWNNGGSFGGSSTVTTDGTVLNINGTYTASLGNLNITQTTGFSTGSILFASNPSASDTITLNGTAWTFVASGAGSKQTNIKGTLALTLAQLVSDLNASNDAQVSKATYGSLLGVNTLNVSYNTYGTAGNSFTLAASAATPSGGTLTGGLSNVQSASSVIFNGSGIVNPLVFSDPENFNGQSILAVNGHHDAGGSGIAFGVFQDGVGQMFVTTSGNAHFLGGIDLPGGSNLWYQASGSPNTLNGNYNGGLMAPPYLVRGYNQMQLGSNQDLSDQSGGAFNFTTNPSNGNQISINGVVWQFVTGAPSGNQTTIGATLAATLTQLASDLSASVVTGITKAGYVATRTSLAVTGVKPNPNGANTTFAIANGGTAAANPVTGLTVNPTAIVGGGSSASTYSVILRPMSYGTGSHNWSEATTGASGTGSTATITFATGAPQVGSTITVAGVTPSGYNGTFTVTASGTGTASYSNATTGAQSVAGTISTPANTVQGMPFHIFDAPSVGPLPGGDLLFSTFTDTAANATENTATVDALRIAGATGSTPGAISFLGITGSTQCLQVDTNGTVAGSGGACAGASFANPTASVGLTAVNGSASTAMRSDAAPALSQAIIPTWTGLHTFTAGSVNTTSGAASTSAAAFQGLPFTGGSGTTTFPLVLFQPTGGTPPTASTSWSTSGTVLGMNLHLGTIGNFVDFQVDGISKFTISPGGVVLASSNFNTSGGGSFLWTGRGILTSPAAATVQIGATDVASPVAQTFRSQGVLAGTTNGAGANLTLLAGPGTGSGTGGSLLLQTATAGGSGTSQNAGRTAVTIDQNSHVLFSSISAPAASACGTSPTVTAGSSDTAGSVTTGTTATGCVITFNKAYTNAPFCTVNDAPAAVTLTSYSVSTSALTLVMTSHSNHLVYYNCSGN